MQGTKVTAILALLALLALTPSLAGGQGSMTTLNFQGELADVEGEPLDGSYNLRFAIYNAPSGGNRIWPTAAEYEEHDVTVSDGLFNVLLGSQGQPLRADQFDGDDRYLQVWVSSASGLGAQSARFETLLPRLAVSSVPHALYASGAWSLTGNAGTNPLVNFLGTTDGAPFVVRVKNEPALRIEPASDPSQGFSPNLIGGPNDVAAGTYGVTIGGGGSSGSPNRVSASYGTISGGVDNVVGGAYATVSGGQENACDGGLATVGGGRSNLSSGPATTVGGGENNVASGTLATVGGGGGNNAGGEFATVSGGGHNRATGGYAAISGGDGNEATEEHTAIGGGLGNAAAAPHAAVGGGSENQAAGPYSVVGGGQGNVITATHATLGGGFNNEARGDYATIGGGAHNVITATHATISGGDHNTATGQVSTVGGGTYNSASAAGATVGGGNFNNATAIWATVPGGSGNNAKGEASFAAGHNAHADHKGSFVWGDRVPNTPAHSWGDNTFTVEAGGGARFYSGSGTGVQLAGGGGSWASLSSRATKENFEPVDQPVLLDRLSEIEVSTWNYKSQDPAIRHIGPMADDFNALLDGLGGEGEAYINGLDADGVALAAIQGLYQLAQEQEAQLAAQQQRIDQLEARLAALELAVGAPGPAQSDVQRGWLPLGSLTLLLGGLVVATGIGARRWYR